jgi:hypothetical protein
MAQVQQVKLKLIGGTAGMKLLPARALGDIGSTPAVTLRVYSHVLREHAVSVGDVFAQAIKTPVSKSVSKPDRRR